MASGMVARSRAGEEKVGRVETRRPSKKTCGWIWKRKCGGLQTTRERPAGNVHRGGGTRAEWLSPLVKASICHWPPWCWHSECVNHVAMGTSVEALHVCQLVKTGPIPAAVERSSEADENFGDGLRIRTLNKHPGLPIILTFSLFSLSDAFVYLYPQIALRVTYFSVGQSDSTAKQVSQMLLVKSIMEKSPWPDRRRQERG